MGAFYLDIKKDLLDKILTGVYPQGSIIPNEYELAEIYNVSRPTIRKAVQILVDERYLEKRKKRGTIVCDPTIRQEFAQVIQTFNKEVKEKGGSRQEFLLRAAREVSGMYVPSLYEVSYKEDGTIASFVPTKEGVPAKITKEIVMDLDNAPYPEKPVVPFCLLYTSDAADEL